MARMAARDRHHVRAAAVDRKMHRHFDRRIGGARALCAVELELDQVDLACEPERAARRDQDAVLADARADMAKTFGNAEMGEHAAGGDHLGALFWRGFERHGSPHFAISRRACVSASRCVSMTQRATSPNEANHTS